MKLSRGFSLIEGLIIIAILAVIIALGYVGWNRWQDSKNTPTKNPESSQTSSDSNDTPTAQPIESEDDLDKASTSLDDASLDDDEATRQSHKQACSKTRL